MQVGPPSSAAIRRKPFDTTRLTGQRIPHCHADLRRGPSEEMETAPKIL